MPYDRDLPGEIMFWDATDVAESLSWERNLTRLAAQLRSLGPDNGRPIPACWVIATQGLFLVTGSLAGFADAARRHGLSAIDNSDGGLMLQEEGSSRRTIVRLLDRNPPQNASPRWWVEQEDEWISWHKTRGRRRSEKPAFTPSASWPCPGWPMTDDHLADIDALIAEARADGRGVTLAEVRRIFKLARSPAQRVMRERGIRTDDEAEEIVRRLAVAGDRRVLAQDVAACGIPQARAAMAVTRYH